MARDRYRDDDRDFGRNQERGYGREISGHDYGMGRSYGYDRGYEPGGRGGGADRSRGFMAQDEDRFGGPRSADEGHYERGGYRGAGFEQDFRGQGGRGYERSQGSYGEGGARHHPDETYRNWREQQLSQFDRDYEEFRKERQGRFDTEFDEWRRQRQARSSQHAAGGQSHPQTIKAEPTGQSGAQAAQPPRTAEPAGERKR